VATCCRGTNCSLLAQDMGKSVSFIVAAVSGSLRGSSTALCRTRSVLLTAAAGFLTDEFSRMNGARLIFFFLRCLQGKYSVEKRFLWMCSSARGD